LNVADDRDASGVAPHAVFMPSMAVSRPSNVREQCRPVAGRIGKTPSDCGEKY